EAALLAPLPFLQLHEQIGPIEEVPAVPGLTREVQLGGEDSAAWRLHFHVEVARAPRVEPRDDGLEPIATAGVGELMAAQLVADVVVFTRFVRVPEVEERAGDGAAIAGEDSPGDHDPRALCAGLDQRAA